MFFFVHLSYAYLQTFICVGVSKQFKFPECQVSQLFTYKNFFTAIAVKHKQNEISVIQNLTEGYPEIYLKRIYNVGIGYHTLKLKALKA